MNLFKKVIATIALTTMTVVTVAPMASAFDSASSVAAANYLAEKGIINDHSNDTNKYNLGQNVLRQEIAAIAKGVAGLDKKEVCNNSFADVSATTPNTWACYSVEALLDAELIASNILFKPENDISKSESLGMVVKAACGDAYSYDSTKDTTWQEQVVAFSYANDITDAFSDYNTPATRGFVFEAAVNAMGSCSEELVCDELLAGLGICEMPKEKDTCANGDKSWDLYDGKCAAPVTGDTEVSLSAENPEDGLIQADAARTTLMMFDVQAGSEDVTLNEATLKFSGLGDYGNLDDVSIYNSIGEKVSKTKSFSEVTRDISFDNDIVIEAGKVMTFTIAGKVVGTEGQDNATYGINLIALDASEGIKVNLEGSMFTPAIFTNVAGLEVSKDTATGDVVIGEEMKLAGFEIEETEDNEDVLIKTVTFHLEGTVDEDDIVDLSVLVEGVEVAADLSINSDEEVVAVLDYKLAADEKVEVELRGTVIGSVWDSIDFVFESNDDIYAVGVDSDRPVIISNEILSEDIADLGNIEGSEINVSFDKSDIDEAKPDSKDVLVGTVNIVAAADGYEVTKLLVTVSGTTTAVEELELNGRSDDSTDAQRAAGQYYFEDIVLKKGEELSLDLTMETSEDVTSGDVTFDVSFVEIEDDNNDATYTDGGTYDIDDILSVNSFNKKTITIETGSFEITNISVVNRDIVLGNDLETVVYKAKISVWDADTLYINDIDFKLAGANSITDKDNGTNIDLDKVVASVEMVVNGQSFFGDVEANTLEFSNVNAEIEAGADNVELLVVVTLKENDAVRNGSILAMDLDATKLTVEDSDGDELVIGDVDTTYAHNKLTQTNLLEKGTFEFAIVTDGENKDDINEVVLAGTNNVALAEFKMEADLEDMDVESLVLTMTGTSTQAGTATGSALLDDDSIKVTVVGEDGNDAVAQEYYISANKVNDGDEDNEHDKYNSTASILSVVLDGTKYESETYKGLIEKLSDTSTLTGTFDQTAYDALDYGYGINTVVTAEEAGTPFSLVDYLANDGESSELVLTPKTFNRAAHDDIAQVTTLTFLRTIVEADTVTVWGADAADIAAVATLLAARADIATAVVNGNTITITAADAGTDGSNGTDIADLDIVATPYPAVAESDVASDLSDSLNNIKLVDSNGTVIADGATITYDPTTEVNTIEFKDFTVTDGEDYIEGLLVADVIQYTTTGDYTTSVLSNFNVNAFDVTDATVEGKSSLKSIETTLFANGSSESESITIVPALVTVTIDNTLGNNDKYAKITFNIEKGTNRLDNDDVVITEIKLEEGDVDSTFEVLRDNDSNNIEVDSKTWIVPLKSNGDIVSWDNFEFKGTDGREIRILPYGIKYTIDWNEYTINNEDIIDLGEYNETTD